MKINFLMDMHSPENPAQDGNMLGIGDWIKLFDSNNKCQLFMAIMSVLISLDKEPVWRIP
jgi:hypothetical protein